MLHLFTAQDRVLYNFGPQRARTGTVVEAKVNGAHGKGRLVDGEERKLCRRKKYEEKRTERSEGKKGKRGKRERRP
jgi:hypothetical protein